ncbi:MAG TPA: DUF1566 domain-containing protein [Terriglobia bacterium]|nr:DUF1566 domain-containing protein [Terriglobia bacterium]
MGTGVREGIQVAVEKDLSTVTIGTARVEVSSDGKKVTAYTEDGVETKAASPGDTGAKATQISISPDFNTVVLNGATIERAADGHLVISTSGTVITKPAAANDSASKEKIAPEAGDEMEDGTIYAGISPDTDKAMYATPRDAPGKYTFNKAAKYAKELDAHGHKDWRVPTKNELNVLYQNRDKGKLKETFNETGSHPAGWYWSSSQANSNGAWVQRFSDGSQASDFRYNYSSLRCVR